MFTVTYLNRATGEKYYRTVHADNATEATRQAIKLERKGFIFTKLERKYNHD